MQHGAAGVEQLGAVAALGLHVHHVVKGGQRDADEARGAAGNRHGIDDANGRLNRRHHAGGADLAAALALDTLKVAFQLVDIVRRVGFRQADHVHAGPHGGLQIQQAKRRAERVNAHHGFDILIHRVL